MKINQRCIVANSKLKRNASRLDARLLALPSGSLLMTSVETNGVGIARRA